MLGQFIVCVCVCVCVCVYVVCVCAGNMFWETYLTNRIVPSKCRLVLKKRCCDVKLAKAEDLNWAEYEVSLW